MTNQRFARSSLLLAASVLVTAGCSSGPATGTVEGVLTGNGNPVTNALIQFESPHTATAAAGKVDATGRFRLDTPLQPGKYRVAVTPVPEPLPAPPPDPLPKPKERHDIPESYRDPSKSMLTFEVQRGSNRFDIDLKIEQTSPSPGNITKPAVVAAPTTPTPAPPKTPSPASPPVVPAQPLPSAPIVARGNDTLPFVAILFRILGVVALLGEAIAMGFMLVERLADTRSSDQALASRRKNYRTADLLWKRGLHSATLILALFAAAELLLFVARAGR